MAILNTNETNEVDTTAASRGNLNPSDGTLPFAECATESTATDALSATTNATEGMSTATSAPTASTSTLPPLPVRDPRVEVHLQHDREISISTGDSLYCKNWIQQQLTLSALYTRLSVPVRGHETQAQYFVWVKTDKERADRLKDVGGFVGGTLDGPRRLLGHVTGRDLITLDLDDIPANGADSIIKTVEALGYGFCIYSTRKHKPESPRLRVIFPLDRTAHGEEYELAGRILMSKIGLECADKTTFQDYRLMYWPSASADAQYVFKYGDMPLVSLDELLANNPGFEVVTNWPRSQREKKATDKKIKQSLDCQGDPTQKPGYVGMFCRAYDIHSAISVYLSDLYESTDDPERYTWKKGSSSKGAVVYDGGKYFVSFHATDPAGDPRGTGYTAALNAFDLVRVHKFGDLDIDSAPKTPASKLPSYTAMIELVKNDPRVKAARAAELKQKAQDAKLPEPLEVTESTEGDNDSESGGAKWQEQLATNKKGEYEQTINNALIILANDSELRDTFALNEFTGRVEVLKPVPWKEQDTTPRTWVDSDTDGLCWYFENVYNIWRDNKITRAHSLHSQKHRFDPVRDYLSGLSWDECERLDTLFIDYLGAADTPYTRAVTRKAFTAAVARAFEPGCKYDQMLILAGPQGAGKSTILEKMSRGWFNDSIKSFEGKEAAELLPGVWLVEISELEAFNRSDVSRIKQFLSLQVDRYRAAYGRHAVEQPRRCAFFGTTNTYDFLTDKTGNRRFWPVDIAINAPKLSIWRDLDDAIDQLWAEAVVRYREGESLYLPPELAIEAIGAQESHRGSTGREGMIAEFLESLVPYGWEAKTIEERLNWLHDPKRMGGALLRDRICPVELWVECFEGRREQFKPADSREFNEIMRNMPEWAPVDSLRCGPYGRQRGYRRTQ